MTLVARFDGSDRSTLRRTSMIAAAIALGLLSLLPPSYVARGEIATGVITMDPKSFGTVGERGGADSHSVEALDRTAAAVAEVSRNAGATIDVHPLRGGIIEIVSVGHDPARALALVKAELAAAFGEVAATGGSPRIADPGHLEVHGKNPPAIAALALLGLLAFILECANGPEGESHRARPEET